MPNHGKFNRLKANIRWLTVLRMVTATTRRPLDEVDVCWTHKWGDKESVMLRKIAIAVAAASLLVAAAIPTDALAVGRGGGGGGFHGGGGGFHGGGGGGFRGGQFGGGFRGGHFGGGFRGIGPGIALGLGLGYGAYSSCYAWTPYGYQWVCGPYPYY